MRKDVTGYKESAQITEEKAIQILEEWMSPAVYLQLCKCVSEGDALEHIDANVDDSNEKGSSHTILTYN